MSIQNTVFKFFMRRATKRMHQKLKGRAPSPRGARRWMDKAIGEFKLPKGVIVQQVQIETMKGEWLIPSKITKPQTMLFLHGGGYFSGSLKSHRPLVAKLAEVTGMKILQIEYRLAPEHPYPAALEDALAAFQWIQTTQELPAKSIFLGGDSAGGGLALCTAIELREQGRTLPKALVLLSPWTDLSVSQATYKTNEGVDPLFSTKYVGQSGQYYAKDLPLNDPKVSPIFADIQGLCPTLIQVGSTEIMLDDSRVLAKKMEAKGVAVQLEVWQGMTHVWHTAWPHIPEAKKAIQKIDSFLSAQLS